MKPLVIQILEFVKGQPAHKLPAIFTESQSPLTEWSASPEEVFQEVLRMQKESLLVAHVNRDCKSNPKQLEVRYATLAGVKYLESKRGKLTEPSTVET